MITGAQLQLLYEKIKKFKYSSFGLEYNDCMNAEIIQDDENLILLLDKNNETSYLYWAADNPQSIVPKIKNIEGKIRIDFVPKEFISSFQDAGFFIWVEYIDFFNEVLKNTDISFNDYAAIQFLQPEDASIVETISISCAGQARGFVGETKEWFLDWMKENNIIIIKAEDEIVGFCCVSIYANGTILWVREITVNPLYQRKGFGRKLLEQAIFYGVKKGAVRGFLHSDILNKNAIDLYNKYNFYARSDSGEIQMIRSC